MDETECKIYGMDYLYALSVGAIRRAAVPAGIKTGLRYSLNCLYRLYGGKAETYPADTAKCGLYEMVCRVAGLNTATTELKAMWYIYFPYCMLAGAPHDPALYAELKETLTADTVFAAVLQSKYCEMIFDSGDDARAEGVDPLVIDWYEPFNEYKFAPDETGDMRIVTMLKRELGLRDFDYAARFSERLLNLFPASGTLILLYAAAVTGSLEGKSATERTAIVTDLLEFIGTVETLTPDIQPELCYYRGLCLIALQRIDEALESFRTCLDLKPGYESALLMIRAIERVGQAPDTDS